MSTASSASAVAMLQNEESMPIAARSQAVMLLTSWLDQCGGDLNAEILALLVANAHAQAAWETGAPPLHRPGLLALHAWCVQRARNVDRGTEIATETWLDVRDRLANAAIAVRSGRRPIDLRHPSPDLRANSERYHHIQARFRLQGKWKRERAMELYEEGQHASPSPEAYLDARTHSLPLFVAALWYQHDTRERDQGVGWWWSALLHGLRLQDTRLDPARRNDPLEAVLRFRVRLSACIGFRRWLNRQARSMPWLAQEHFQLPEPADASRYPAFSSLLTRILASIEPHIQTLPATNAEKAALLKILVYNRTARTNLKWFSGDSVDERRNRMCDLAEIAATSASIDLLGDDDNNTPNHAATRGDIRVLASGRTLPAERMQAFQRHISTCPECMGEWMAVCEVGVHEATLLAPQPPPRRAKRMAVGALVLAVAAISVLPLWSTTPSAPQLRGSADQVSVKMDLLVHPRGAAQAIRYQNGAPLSVGDRLYFRVFTQVGTSAATVWVTGPGGQEVVGQTLVRPDPTWLSDEKGRLFYIFDKPGTYVMHVGPDAPPTCDAPTCMSQTIVVEEARP